MKKYIGSAVMIAALIPMLAFAGTFVADEDVSINTGDPIADNLYVAGGNISVNDVIEGDLLTAGGQILVTGDVTEDITLAGGNLTVLGNAGGDVRVAGGSILVTGTVGGDLIGVGGSLTVASDVSVGKDLMLVGGQLSVDGDVAGDAELTGGVITLNSRVQGDVVARFEEKMTIGPNAVIDGNLEYYAAREDALTVADGATIAGEVTFSQKETVNKAEVESALATAVGGFMIFKLLATLATALILVWLFKRFSNTVVRNVVQNPLKQLGLGFVTLIVVPVAIVFLFATLLGIPLGLIALITYLLLLLVAGSYGGIVFGAWVSQLISQSNEATVSWQNAILGVIGLSMITLIPVVGWIISFLIFLMTLGSVANQAHQTFWSNR